MVELTSAYDDNSIYIKADDIVRVEAPKYGSKYYERSVITLSSKEQCLVMETPCEVNELVEKDLNKNNDRLASLEARVDKLLDILVEQARSQSKENEKSNILKKSLSSKKKENSREKVEDKSR